MISSVLKLHLWFSLRSARAMTGRRSARLAVTALVSVALADAALASPRHAIAMHGEPALSADFAHFAYVDPAAPKGGRMVQSALGTFDSLNPLVVKGLAA